MISLLTQTVPHSTRLSFRSKTNNQPNKKSCGQLSKSCQKLQNSDFQSQFLDCASAAQPHCPIFLKHLCHLVSDLKYLGHWGCFGHLGHLGHLDCLGCWGSLGKNLKYVSLIAQPMGLKDFSVLYMLQNTNYLNLSKFFFIESFHFRSTFFVIDIF
jgi:hypothetical protein